MSDLSRSNSNSSPERLPSVIVLDSAVVPDSDECELEERLLSPVADVRHIFVDSEDEIIAHCSEAGAIILWHHVRLTAAVLARLHGCQVIVRNGVGVDNVDVEAAAQHGIPVCNVPDYGTEEVADHAVALALCLVRNILPAASDVRGGAWNWRSARPVRRCREQVFGILGCGRIGTAAAMRAKAFGFRVVFYDPYLSDGVEKALGIGRVGSLEELAALADVLSLHVPLTPETHHMISAKTVTLLKPQSVLVNTARGPIVDQEALRGALQSGRLSGVGLDVVETEPSFDRDLLNHPNCIITPHCAFYSEDSWQEMRRKSALTVLDVFKRRRLRNVVNGVSWRQAGQSRNVP